MTCPNAVSRSARQAQVLTMHTGSIDSGFCRNDPFSCRNASVIIPNPRIESANNEWRARRKQQEEEGGRRRRHGRPIGEEE